MRSRVLFAALLFTWLAFPACAPTRLTRDRRPEALMSTIMDPLQRDCGNLLTARQYCNTTAPPGHSEPKRTPSPCEKLYSAALRAAAIQCGYDDELAHLHRAGEYSRTDYITDRIRQIHLKYNARAEQVSGELEETYKGLPSPLSDEEELTYHNVAWSLRAFRARIRFENPRSSRQPASKVTDESLGRLPPDKSYRDLMKRLLVPKNRPPHETYETRELP